MSIDLTEILKLSVPEKLEVMEILWDSMVSAGEEPPIPDWQIEEIERRIEEHEKNPQATYTLDEVRERILGRYGA
jgi:putative addiction module component (TIGR02574 family)